MVKLILCGDTAPTAATVPAFDAGDTERLMGDVLPILNSGDATIINLECALTNSDAALRKCGPNLKGRPEYARVLRECGITHCGLSNNHTLDFGIAGLRDTLAALDANGLAHFGTGENEVDSRKYSTLELNGMKIAVLAVCEHEYSYALADQFGTNPFDPFETMQDISAARAESDAVIVMYHGGKEQCPYPSPRLRKACQAMVRAGAALVLCEHSHCIGCMEEYAAGRIVYGMGNFNFAGYVDHPHWKSGLIGELTLDGDASTFELIPVVTNAHGIQLARDDEKAQILAGFAVRSAKLADSGAWLGEWRAFCKSVQKTYIAAARDAFIDIPDGESVQQLFPHYLDCEAHLDVWKELFKTWHADKTDHA